MGDDGEQTPREGVQIYLRGQARQLLIEQIWIGAMTKRYTANTAFMLTPVGILSWPHLHDTSEDRLEAINPKTNFGLRGSGL